MAVGRAQRHKVRVLIEKKHPISGQKTSKPNFLKIRQKSNFAPILMGRISKFLEEQDLSEKQGQTSVATIFKFTIINLANLKIVATLL